MLEGGREGGREGERDGGRGKRRQMCIGRKGSRYQKKSKRRKEP